MPTMSRSFLVELDLSSAGFFRHSRDTVILNLPCVVLTGRASSKGDKTDVSVMYRKGVTYRIGTASQA